MFDLKEIKPGFHIRLKEMSPEQLEEVVTAAFGRKRVIVENSIVSMIGVDMRVVHIPWQSIMYGLPKTAVRYYRKDYREGIATERYVYLIEDAIEYITDDNGVVVYRYDQTFCAQEESIEDSSDLSEFIESFQIYKEAP